MSEKQAQRQYNDLRVLKFGNSAALARTRVAGLKNNIDTWAAREANLVDEIHRLDAEVDRLAKLWKKAESDVSQVLATSVRDPGLAPGQADDYISIAHKTLTLRTSQARSLREALTRGIEGALTSPTHEATVSISRPWPLVRDGKPWKGMAGTGRELKIVQPGH